MNIAEILKYCPEGTKLYSTVFGKVELYKVYKGKIAIKIPYILPLFLDGKYRKDGECVLFPSKDQRDWKKFRLPVKRGDIMMIPNTDHAFITTGRFTDNGSIRFVCGIDADNKLFINPSNAGCTSEFYIPASEEAKKKLFDKMAEAGYKWNADTLELEEIEPKFKEGDILVDKYNRLTLCTKIINEKIQTCADLYYKTLIPYQPTLYNKPISSLRLATEEERNTFYSALVREGYKYDKEQHKLIKQEFKPFDKVLVRNNAGQKWLPTIFLRVINDSTFKYLCLSSLTYEYCIPYEGNEYLLDTTDSPI